MDICDLIYSLLKRDSSPQNQKYILYFPLACSSVYPSRLFWCELMSLSNVCLRSKTLETDGAQLVVR